MVSYTPPQATDNISYVVDTAALSDLLTQQTSIGIIYIFIGSVAILLAAIFLKLIKYSYFKGMAIPLLLLGTVEVLEGIASLSNNLDRPANFFFADNLHSLFLNRIFIYSSLVGLVVGILLYLRFLNSPRVFWKGMGLTLLIQSFLLLSLFSLKEKRLNGFNHAIIETKRHY